MKEEYSVKTKEEALYFNRKVYNGDFGSNYDKTHSLKYTHYSQRIFQKNVKDIIDNLRKAKNSLNLIDIGTGTGSLSLNYYKNIKPSDTVTNVDISKKMIELLKLKLTQEQINQSIFVIDDAYTFLAKSQLNFDLIGFAGALHHFYDYEKVIDMACKNLKPFGYLYIALEPKMSNNYIEKTVINYEHIIQRYKKRQFSFTRCIIKILYNPFHFLNNWFLGKSVQVDVPNSNPDLEKSEVVTSGLDLYRVKEILKTNELRIIKLSSGTGLYSCFHL